MYNFLSLKRDRRQINGMFFPKVWLCTLSRFRRRYLFWSWWVCRFIQSGYVSGMGKSAVVFYFFPLFWWLGKRFSILKSISHKKYSIEQILCEERFWRILEHCICMLNHFSHTQHKALICIFYNFPLNTLSMKGKKTFVFFI